MKAQPDPAMRGSGSTACCVLLVLAANTGVAAEPDSGSRYVLPDLSEEMFVYDGTDYWFRPLVAIVADYTFFEQDQASFAQVGRQEDSRDLRAGRLGFALRSKSELEWSAFFAVDYQEPRTRDDRAFKLYDLRFRLPLGGVNIDVGKQKQPFVFEMAGLSILNPQQERILSPFFVTRSIGVRASGQLAGDRMTWAAGWYNDWLESGATFSDNADDYVARLTGLLHVSADNRDYLHLGIGVRRAGPDAGIVRLSGRPESNVADRYVDTGDFEADFVAEVALELAWDHGPLLLVAEHVETRAKAPASGDPQFSGSYLMLSWMLTGESRPYLRETGSTGPVTPSSETGAFELVTRYSHLDLADGSIDGGILDKWHFGANWWISRQWKAGLSYGDANLDRNSVIGNTRIWLLRIQWYY